MFLKNIKKPTEATPNFSALFSCDIDINVKFSYI